jgi:hypothetical protein
MKTGHSILLIAMLGLAGCRTTVVDRQAGTPMPIIVQPDARDKTDTPKQYVMLKLPYGLIIHNGDYPPGAPLFCLFDRDEKRILKTQNVNVLLTELKRIPDGATIDMVSKCTVAFYNQYGINIDEQYEKIASVLKKKRFKLVDSLEDDERHASFCYCEGGFTLLDEPKKSEQSPAGDVLKAAPEE